MAMRFKVVLLFSNTRGRTRDVKWTETMPYSEVVGHGPGTDEGALI